MNKPTVNNNSEKSDNTQSEKAHLEARVSLLQDLQANIAAKKEQAQQELIACKVKKNGGDQTRPDNLNATIQAEQPSQIRKEKSVASYDSQNDVVLTAMAEEAVQLRSSSSQSKVEPAKPRAGSDSRTESEKGSTFGPEIVDIYAKASELIMLDNWQRSVASEQNSAREDLKDRSNTNDDDKTNPNLLKSALPTPIVILG